MKSHDGVKDALTHLASPTLLYEELRRELSRASRSGSTIYGIKIVLSHSSEQSEPISLVSAEMWEREILVLAQLLHTHTRGEDISARMGDEEFLILLVGYMGSPEIFIQRFMLSLKNVRDKDAKLRSLLSPIFSISFRKSHSSDSPLKFLNQLDLAIPIKFEMQN